MEFEALVCYSQLLILLVIVVAYLYHYRPGPHAKWTFSVIACGLLLFVDALLLPAGGWLQLALKAVMVVGAIGCLLTAQWVVEIAPEGSPGWCPECDTLLLEDGLCPGCGHLDAHAGGLDSG
ncbi:MAG: hypothetical protein BEU05_00810 [Marine Group III euryarchaeote CG-Bathy2]|uniref:Uncharacterized protein n=2 Tax=Methanobacteriati TaxID=3366610 RepID=A0A075GD69_9EURY|nr:hypothetical protein [uncultured marine group II/III euryarchaeote KM3_152_H07]OIR11269.1 MAG: hypothetical protein BEU05_00810 [Marine Group III euryarchaeote CG-Bathy2]